jgi:hypothetical protein
MIGLHSNYSTNWIPTTAGTKVLTHVVTWHDTCLPVFPISAQKQKSGYLIVRLRICRPTFSIMICRRLTIRGTPFSLITSWRSWRILAGSGNQPQSIRSLSHLPATVII